MAKIYYRRIKDGAITIDDVPERWRAQVQALLDADECGRYRSTYDFRTN